MKKLITLLALAFCLNGKSQIITTVAGNGTSGYSGDGGQATNAEFNRTKGLVFDNNGNLYVADQFNSLIRRIDTLGIITTIAGGGSSGLGDGGQATAAQLNVPSDICLDTVGNLYIVDSNNNRIRKVNTMGVISTVAGNGYGAGTTGGYSGDGGQATDAELWSPCGIKIDSKGNLYITDGYNYRVRMINTIGVISTFIGTGTSGYSGDGGQATSAEVGLTYGINIDALGNLYIVDSDRIRMVNSSGVITTIAGGGSITGDGGQATAAGLSAPQFIVFDMLGNLYISDIGNDNKIRVVNTMGVITTIAGNGTHGYTGDGGLATMAELNCPSGIAIDLLGNLFISDYFNNRIRKVCNSSCTIAGIEQIPNNKEQLNIYPNPNNGSFVLEPNNATKQSIQMYDVTGKLVLSQSINGRTSVDASSLNEGVYNISISSNEGIVNKRLVIVR